MNGLALCAGVGGLELGLKLALPESYQTVGYVERDAYSAAVLVARMAEQTLDPAPVWDDLSTFEGTPWRGCVDLISAGFPCQPVSTAGKQLVEDDHRWLWPEVARIIREVGPSFVYLENVPGLLVRGLGDVLRDLAELGFAADWDVFSAAGVGAPHLRRRVFLLARRVPDAISNPLREQPERGPGAAQAAEPRDAEPRDLRENGALAHASSIGRQQGTEVPQGRKPEPPSRGEDLADADRRGLEGERQPEPPRIQSTPGNQPDRRGREVPDPHGGGLDRRTTGAGRQAWEFPAGHDRAEPDEAVPDPSCAGPQGGHPPGAQDPQRQATPGLGWPTPGCGWWWATEPDVGRVAHGVPHRVDRLRCLGNGVVPAVAARAWRVLHERIMTR